MLSSPKPWQSLLSEWFEDLEKDIDAGTVGDKVYLCLSCGELNGYWKVCEACQTASDLAGDR